MADLSIPDEIVPTVRYALLKQARTHESVGRFWTDTHRSDVAQDEIAKAQALRALAAELGGESRDG